MSLKGPGRFVFLSSPSTTMATPEAQAALAAHQALVEQLDIHAIHKTFRSPHWRPNQRRNKNVKTILGDASRKEASAAATPQDNSGANTPSLAALAAANSSKAKDANDDSLSTSGSTTPATAAAASGDGFPPNLAQANRSLSKLVLEKNLRTGGNGGAPSVAMVVATLGASAPTVTYTNIESAPSLAPQRRYCDITGLNAPYTDPKTRLRYHNSEVFAVIRGFQQGVAEQYLEMRGAHTVLK